MDSQARAGSGPAAVFSDVALAGLQRRIRVARGLEPGDLKLVGGQVVNVFTERVEPANLVLADGWIAAVGPEDWSARESIEVSGRFVLPGLIDSHMHLESTLLAPRELVRLVVPHGTTATISDSHEVGNVLGLPGIDQLMAASRGLAFDLFFTASSCVPATPWDDSGAVLGPAEVRALLDRPRVLGLAEMMDFPGVLAGDAGDLDKMLSALNRQGVVDGHAPGLAGRDLAAYVAAGIRSDHESTTAAEARAKAALGMLVQVREGSSARNLDAILPSLVSGELGDNWCLVTDDIFPTDLLGHGHIDGLLRRVVEAGMPPAEAVRHATLVPARHYGLRDRGAVAPGYRADLVVVEDLHGFRSNLVLKNGQAAARDGRFLLDQTAASLSVENTVRLAALDESAFRLRLSSETVPIIRIEPGQLTTRREAQTIRVENGEWKHDPSRDVALIASLERHRATGRIGLGLVAGFGLRDAGALGSSVAHDSHNLIVAGTEGSDMLAAVRALCEMGGGFVVVSRGEVRARLPLPFAGLISEEPYETVCRRLDAVNQAAQDLGCPLEAPFGTLSFLALPVIPELRITDQGLFDVVSQEFLKL